MKAPVKGGRSPWGTIQHVQTIVPGHIWVVSTAGHGGVKLDPSYNRIVDPIWRNKGGWYEEDVEFAVVLITFQNSFPKGKVNMDSVRSTLERYYPKEYADWHAVEKSIEQQRGRPYDAAEIKAEAEQASVELAAMFPKPRKKRPARIFTSEHRGTKYIQVDPGDMVLCDFCARDWTDDPTSGGFIFSGHAVCPACAPKELEKIKGYGEESEIQGFCPPDMSFADWIRSTRRA